MKIPRLSIKEDASVVPNVGLEISSKWYNGLYLRRSIIRRNFNGTAGEIPYSLWTGIPKQLSKKITRDWMSLKLNVFFKSFLHN